jgi:WD40 repeat protein
VFDTTTGDVRLRVEVSAPDIAVSENSGYVAPAISADGGRLAVAVGDARIEVWDVHAQQRIADLSLDAAELDVPIRISGPPEFGPDGQHVAIALFIAVLDFDVATGTATTLLSPAIVQGPLRYVGAEGVVGSGVRGQIRRWDLSSGTIVAEGHSADPTSLSGVAISADGSLVASAHPFTSAFVLFDGDTLAQIGDPVPAGIAVGFSQPVLSADGRYLYANDVFDRAARWDVDPDSWVRVACRAAGRNLTRTEFSTYFGAEATYRATCDEWPVDE